MVMFDSRLCLVPVRELLPSMRQWYTSMIQLFLSTSSLPYFDGAICMVSHSPRSGIAGWRSPALAVTISLPFGFPSNQVTTLSWICAPDAGVGMA